VIVGVIVVLGVGGLAAAQPGPPPIRPPAYHALSQEDLEALQRGEISEFAHLAGGLVGTFVGFGIGQAVQGRYHDTGWIFTVGESVSFGLVVVGLVRCVDLLASDGGLDCEDRGDLNWLIAGLVGLVGFRIWELVDVWGGPVWHNDRVRSARLRAYPPAGLGLYLAPPAAGRRGGVAGISLRF
jgi:hypothetical protein